jgi:hypothetical protein
MPHGESFISHKFKSLDEYCWKSLETSEFYFSLPEKLNDPADCQVDLAKAFRLARAETDKTHSRKPEEWFMRVASDIQEKALTCGVFSLCSGAIDGDGERLLWAYYASNHTGICLTFCIPYSFVNDHLVGCAPVHYSNDALYDALRALDLSLRPDFDSEIKPIITAFLTTKSPEWKHERESRLISFDAKLVAFDRSWLQQICFGLRTSYADRKRVKELAAAYPNCSLVEAVQSEDDLFGLTLREL